MAYDPESIVWSPDSAKLAAYRVRPGYRRMVHRVESSPADQVQPRLLSQLYVKPGDAVDLDEPRVFHVNPARQLIVPNELFPNPYVMSRLTWRQDSRTVAFEYTERGHQALRIIEVDAATGKARAVVSEETKTFINSWRKFSHDVKNAGKEIIWMSERDGWNHLYLYDGDAGRVKNQITKGEWVVRGVVKVDEDKRQIWFSASGMYPGKDPYFVHFYRVNFDGIQPDDADRGRRESRRPLLPDMTYFIDTYSRVDLPTRVRAAPHERWFARRDAREGRHLGPPRRRLEGARGIRRQGPRRQDRHLGRHHPADELRSQARSIPSSRTSTPGRTARSCRRRSGRSARIPRATRSSACSRWPSWASSSCRSTAWGR